MDESFAIRLLQTEYVVIDKTVHPDKKLITDTSNTPKASMTGLMIIPPPMPQIAPMIEAEKLMIKNKIYIQLASSLYTSI